MPDKNTINIHGDLNVEGDFVAGDKNVTIIQKFFNIFKSDAETLEQRNRRILLGHVENAWIKGVLDASLHGAALLDLGIKPDPNAVTQYPWTIKKESTDETLPAGTSMLEIFDSIGMGRSLLILGAPGSGKTTMLLELARGLIARAREDVTQPIPMVFNLASWTEKLTLADWLAQELNNLYSVPRKTSPNWVKGDKLLLLLDGLDEVRQESRAKCVEAINAFRKEHGLTSLAVCSRSQDYADLKAKLSFEGAIEVQPLTQEQIAEFFNHFGNEMAGSKQAFEKDSALREMAETPLFLGIILIAYRDKRDVEILVSGDERARRKYLFDVYIERMFERPHSKNVDFKKEDVLHWLSWLASKIMKHNTIPYMIEDIQPEWIEKKKRPLYGFIVILLFGLVFGLNVGILSGMLFGLNEGLLFALRFGLFGGVHGGLLFCLGLLDHLRTIDSLSWNWVKKKEELLSVLLIALAFGLSAGLAFRFRFGLIGALLIALTFGLSAALLLGLLAGLKRKKTDQITYPRLRLVLTAENFLFVSLLFGLLIGLLSGLLGGLFFGLLFGIFTGVRVFWALGSFVGLLGGLVTGISYGGDFLIGHYAIYYLLARNNLLPWRLVPFLDHCVDLIFLRRVGGGYIFIHRLLMEHFAEMYVETPASKGN